ncbi:hypothetical protein AU210_001891 [Fusarium oxysporum f. sp. radicis-cucumerinum]|uniref:non-specific serine/threonine protein kinase n=4 Tax=Fusarium oxysporum TaxID=5507 RepID=A0A2H3HW99_FUSOX|nr:hypothetical protein AU210_001891 [Fusarium oxysporum f. sp. radicis-cucumerinum]RKK28334.1 hypothetical protein BFJ65_g278 [Fusarium oxysporum f. sp. cepae]RKK36333.1 hypothetical protein BFJ67_g12843 [Fusarium oxysporum f. sp. cepae]RKK39734.1 hypothetical protein BFJ66_g11855 [Fusarium oxysporum f. sp. cepae]
MSIELTLDASISFGRRQSTRLWSDSARSDVHEQEKYDFLALITAIANLYSQNDILEMQGRQDTGKPLSNGAVSEVSTIYAAVTRPSTIISHQTRTQKSLVVVKRSESKLFHPDGRCNDKAAIRSFISEIQILSHRSLRQHPNIVKILGVHWDYRHTGYPEPLILLEKANMDLRKFQAKYFSLPFATKKAIALNIVCGLSAIHECGVIHGDLKPANVLIFFKPVLHAKIADFSHSFLDTGEQRQLIGGTPIYAAPEWQASASTGQLRKVDIYSLGLVLSGLVLGTDLIDCFERNPPRLNLNLSLADSIQKVKDDDLMATYLYELIYLADKQNPDLHLDSLPMIRSILESTLQLDPGKRHLDKVIHLLSSRECENVPKPERVQETLISNALSIPYAALQGLSPLVMDQVVKALQVVADSPIDTRRAAACLELAICQLCELGKSNAYEFPQRTHATAFNYLLKAASLGNLFAQAIAECFSKALQEEIPSTYLFKDWLYDAATAGSRTALESLKHVDTYLHAKALGVFRSTFCGNPEKYFGNALINRMSDLATVINGRGDTALHWLASTGQTERLASLTSQRLSSHVLNIQNHQKDTPLLCATRAGHYNTMAQLLSCGADASVTNAAGENALHFLGSLDEQDVYSAAHMLLASGAAPDVDATAYTGNTLLQTRPTGGGCPKLRAVLSDNPHVLRVLLELRKPSMQGARIENPTTLSKQRLMLAWAVRLHHTKVLEVLHEFFASSGLFSNLKQLRFWVDGVRQSLPEMCVRGCVSGTGTTGFDMPQEFIQLVHYGSNSLRYLEQTLTFLETLSPGIMAMGCNGARNALFFAIREGRRDAVRILAMFETSRGKSLFVDSPTLSKKLDERGQQITNIPARYRLGKRFRFRENPRHLSSISCTPRSFLTTSSGDSYDSESDQAYDNIPEPVLSKKQQRRRMMHRLRDMRTPPPSPYGSDSTDFSSSDEGPENSDTEDNGDIRTSTAWTAWNDARKEDEWKNPRPALPVTVDGPTDHYSLGGYVDAILLSVYYGKRAIFYDLISGPGSNTMRTESPFLCYAYHDWRAVFDLKCRNDFRGYFPRTAWDCPVVDVRGDQEKFVEFDGRLCYPLAYMTAIARSVHRDICLAHILLMVMKQGDIPEPVGWTAKSWFEDKCLSLDSCSGQSTPLFHAAAHGWDELSVLLLDHGAFPQSACFYNSSGKIRASTVLARLIVTTKNDEGKVQNLLATAASQSTEVIITVQDVNVIIGQSLHAGEDIVWNHGVLSWKCSSFSNENSDVRLWQAVAAANSSQRQKLQDMKAASSALLMEAACRRHLYAVATLLEIGVDPNMGCSSWLIISPRITALDIVAWTMYIRSTDCDDSGRALKERDVKISALLRSWGGVRGVEYTVEYQLLMNIVHTLIIPIAGTGLLVYTLYSIAPFIPVSWRQSWRLTKQCTTDDDSSEVLETIVFFTGKLMAIFWELGIAIPVACYIFMDPQTHRHEKEINIAGYIMALMIAVGIGAFFTTSPCLTEKTETHARDAFYFGLLFDGLLGLLITVVIISVCFVVQVLSGFWLLRPLKLLGASLQGGCPPTIVWRATHSSLWNPATGIMNTLINFVVKWDRPWEIGSFHLSWRSRIQLQLNNDLENYVESNYQIWPDEIVESHGNQAHRPP